MKLIDIIFIIIFWLVTFLATAQTPDAGESYGNIPEEGEVMTTSGVPVVIMNLHGKEIYRQVQFNVDQRIDHSLHAELYKVYLINN